MTLRCFDFIIQNLIAPALRTHSAPAKSVAKEFKIGLSFEEGDLTIPLSVL